ncbi:MAG TPA: trypsin-like peptidase domain-containing protein [Vicinamibacterales bacterium]|nr:trypsin-like peptidase domain-containing protein [Vicinamibacterales bacterium]
MQSRTGLVVLLALCLSPPPAAQTARPQSLTELSRSFENLAQKVSPSVVQIFVTGYALPDDNERTVGSAPVLERGSGSGVIVSADGYVVTNAHVIENATRLEVELPFAATGGAPGRSILGRRGRMVGAQIVAVDEETDLAVIKVASTALPALAFGDSDSLRPGQIVLAFGSPLGLSSSVTMGVVSAVARQLTPEDPMIYIQTDAPINPGNSGGALVDTEGRLVGINTLIFSQSGGNEGIGFAAPSNIVRNIVGQITKFGRVRRGEIGVNAQTITPLLAEALGLPVDNGVILSDVAQGSPAAKAGLTPGDIVTALDGKPMENGRQLRINVYAKGAGEQVGLDVRRGEQTLSVRVAVAERPTETTRLEDLIGQQQAIPNLGVTVLDLTPAIAQVLPQLRRRKGAVIARVAPDAPFSQQGKLLPGDVVYALNGKEIDNAAGLRALAADLKALSAAVLQVERQGVLHYVSFRVER